MSGDTVTIPQGVTGGLSWPITNPDGSAATLTGYTARCQVRRHARASSRLLVELEARIVGSSVVVDWTDEQTRAWTWTRGAIDVILRDATGAGRVIVWRGAVEVLPAVTARG